MYSAESWKAGFKNFVKLQQHSVNIFQFIMLHFHSEPGYQKKSRKINFTSFFMHKKFVKPIFKAKIQFLCSKYEPDLTPKLTCSVFSRKNAQTRLLLLDSAQNLATIGIGLKVLRSVTF